MDTRRGQRVRGRGAALTTVRMAVWTVALLLAFGLWLTGADQARAAGCDAVPEKYQALKNPVTALSKVKLRYWSKQYRAKCARCHGEDGGGGGDDAKEQKVPPAKFTDKAFMAQCSDGQLFYQINFGGENRSAMPGFGPESSQGWSEEKLWHMVAFIRRFAR